MICLQVMIHKSRSVKSPGQSSPSGSPVQERRPVDDLHAPHLSISA